MIIPNMPAPKISLLTQPEDRRRVTPAVSGQAEATQILELTKPYTAFGSFLVTKRAYM